MALLLNSDSCASGNGVCGGIHSLLEVGGDGVVDDRCEEKSRTENSENSAPRWSSFLCQTGAIAYLSSNIKSNQSTNHPPLPCPWPPAEYDTQRNPAIPCLHNGLD